MKDKKLYFSIALLVIAGLLLGACKGATTEAPTEEVETPKEPVKILFMTESPMGINPYFLNGLEGFERAIADFDFEHQISECTGDPMDKAESLRASAREDWDLIILMTFGFEDALKEVASTAPEKTFVCIDCWVEAPNVLSVDYAMYESAYIHGIAMGLLAKETGTNTAGCVSAMKSTFMDRWEKPFFEAALSVNPDLEIHETLYVDSYADPVKSKELALVMANDGVKHVLSMVAAGNPGLFEAAEETGFYVYDCAGTNGCPNLPGQVVESNLKRVDVVVYNIIRDYLAGERPNGLKKFTLAEGACDLAVFTFPDEDTQCLLEQYPEIVEKVREVRQQIIDGTLVIPDPLYEE